MLKLAKLPDPKTTKITFTASAKLKEDLDGYAALYRNTYGETASVSELLPFILASFLESDHAFTKARREGAFDPGGKPTSRARNHNAGSALASAATIQTTAQIKGDKP